jgi:thioredoxin reductase (NADPH)
MADKETDVVVIGAGPAGLSAALWCRDLGLEPVILDAGSEAGGQLLWTHNPIDNYLGVSAENGREIRDLFVSHVQAAGLDVICGKRAVGIDPGALEVLFADGSLTSGKAIIAATGVRRRETGIRGLERFFGKGLLESGKNEKDSVTGLTVAVVGGGDAAFENALILSETASRVILIHRRDSFTARDEFTSVVASTGNIDVLTSLQVKEVRGEERVGSIVVRNLKTGEQDEIEVGAVIFRIGVVPNSELLSEHVTIDKRGYVIVDDQCRTSAAGIWAVGDVANPVSPTIASAAGMGATSAKSILSWLIQSSDIE